jgi:membrane associated rhomboid family serine protease
MAELTTENLESVLRSIAAAGPEPWYPKLHAESSGVARDSLDAPLEKLRVAGLIRLTDWVKDRGQGYVLTPEGTGALNDGKTLARVRDGKLSLPSTSSHAVPRTRGASAYERGEEVRSFFLYPTRPIVTRILLFANLFVFLAGYLITVQQKLAVNEYLAGQLEGGRVPMNVWRVLHALGAMSGDDILQGGWQWLRLLSSGFVHIGLLHLVMNSAALYMLGRDAEAMYGRARFFIIYLIGMIGGSCGMLVEQTSGGAGASGAICGLLGAIAVWFLLNRPYMPPEVASRGFRVVAINVILVVGISLVPHVSKGGHLGGALAGAATALALHFGRYGNGVVRWLALATVPLIPIVFLGALLHTMNSTARWAVARERVRDNTAIQEQQDLNDRYHRDAAAAVKSGSEAVARASHVLDKRPSRRTPEEKEQAIDSLVKAQTDLLLAKQKLTELSAYSNAEIEETRQEVMEYLQARADLCAIQEQFLLGDQNVLNENQNALQQRVAKVQELHKKLFGKDE